MGYMTGPTNLDPAVRALLEVEIQQNIARFREEHRPRKRQWRRFIAGLFGGEVLGVALLIFLLMAPAALLGVWIHSLPAEQREDAAKAAVIGGLIGYAITRR